MVGELGRLAARIAPPDFGSLRRGARVDLRLMSTLSTRMSGFARRLGFVRAATLGRRAVCPDLKAVACGCVVGLVLAAAPALGQELPAPSGSGASGRVEDGAPSGDQAAWSTAARSADSGMFLPLTLAPRTDGQRAMVRVLGGYDGARERMQFDAVADVTVWGPLAIRAGAMYGQKQDSFRPTIGLRVQALSQEKYGIDLGFGGFYKPEGFTEAEGEIEVMVLMARRFGRLATFANLVYGQDPEAAERDGELRMGALYAIATPLQAGIDARLRFDLGSEEGKRRAEGGAEYDLSVGPTASYALGPVAAIAQAGLSVYGTSPARVGAVALLGLGGAL